MFFDHPKRLIFVHNPKTGGRSIIKLLELDDSESFRFAHMSCDIIRNKIVQNDWDKFFSFCVVRNPWRRYVSLHNFQRSPAYAAMMGNNLSSNLAGRFELNDWIEYNALSPQKANWFGIDQKRWWSGVTKVYRFEELEAAHIELSRKFDLNAPLPHENASPPMPQDGFDALNDRSKAIIAEIERETIEEFGYVAK